LQGHLVTHLISAYGAGFVGLIIALECLCIPVPGETALLTAAVYAGRTHNLDIWSVLLAAFAGAVCGNLLAFWIGRNFGRKLLWHYGGYLHLTRARLKIGQYLFQLHGGKFVIFARFVPLLRSFAGALAGANDMPFGRFLIANVIGAAAWVGFDGTAAYYLGKELARLATWAGIALGCLVVLAAITLGLFLRRHEKRLALQAERALPDADDFIWSDSVRETGAAGAERI
jgi:membrane protein DedA with SNARE-associated domain